MSRQLQLYRKVNQLYIQVPAIFSQLVKLQKSSINFFFHTRVMKYERIFHIQTPWKVVFTVITGDARDLGSIPKRLGISLWGGKIPWRRKWPPTLAFLPGEFHEQRSLAGYHPWGHEESDMTEHAHTNALSFLGTTASFISSSDLWPHVFIVIPDELQCLADTWLGPSLWPDTQTLVNIHVSGCALSQYIQ